jgi:hypothetical protein
LAGRVRRVEARRQQDLDSSHSPCRELGPLKFTAPR